MKMRTLAAAVGIVALLTAGCSDPKAANHANFKQAIQAQLDHAYPHCYITQNFPTVIEFDVGRQRQILAALTKAGLVATADKQVEAMSFGNITRHKTVTEYSLTDEGRKHYKADAAKSLGGATVGGFCFGKAKVTDIDEFTEPADMMGARVSRVRYRYQVSDIPSWATSDDLVGAIPQLKKDAGAQTEPAQANAVLVLTSTGWQHEASMRR